MHITVKQGIDNCYLAHQYEHPGYEEDRCAGLRTGNGGGEPIDKCKECALYYGNREIQEVLRNEMVQCNEHVVFRHG